MNPQDLVPAPDAIPSHWGWFHLLLMVTFILHLLFMNTMLGSGIIAVVREFWAGKDKACDMNKDLSKKLPHTVAFTVNLGVAPLLFLQVLYGHFMYTSSILMAVYWLSLILVLIIGYYCFYIYDFKFDSLGPGRKIFLTIGVVLMLWTGFIFSNNMTLMIQPERWGQYFTNPFGTILNLDEPMLIPRYLHFVTASVAVAGLFQAVVYQFKSGRDDSGPAIRSGLKWFAGATCIQFLVGVWFLVSLPGDKMMMFLGQSGLKTFVLSLGILFGLAGIFFALGNRVWATVGAAFAAIVMMVITRDLLRRAYLEPYFSPESLTLVPENSPLVFFLVSFAAGIGVIVYMLKLAAPSQKGGGK